MENLRRGEDGPVGIAARTLAAGAGGLAWAAATLRTAAPAGVHRRGWWWLAPLLVAAVLCRLPPLLNARGVNSDAAIVGLQARHILRGEWSWFLWGTDYQGAGDPLVVALGFALAGDSALTLTLVPLLGHLLLIVLTFATLRRWLGGGPAAVASLPVVFAPHAVNSVALQAPRQWAITGVAAAVWLLDGASASRRPRPRLAAGAALGMSAIYLDLFAAQFAVGLAAFALACCLDGVRPGPILRGRAVAGALGLAAGLALVWALRRQVPATAAAAVQGLEFSAARLGRNAALLWQTCLPWVLSDRAFVPSEGPGLTPWPPPLPFRLVQRAGAVALVVGILLGGAAPLLRRLPWPVRRLGGFGCLVSVTALGGFLVSAAPFDAWGARYLAPIVWTAPFALAPAAHLLGGRRFALALAPYVVAAAVGGWLGFGAYVQGVLPVRHPRGVAVEEAQLGAELRARGVTAAAAHYWLAYRLTFLWGEAPVVAPLDPGDDRYPPYRRALAGAPVGAFIFHPAEPRATPEPCAGWLRRAGVPYERLAVGEFTALIWRRDVAAGLENSAVVAGCHDAGARRAAGAAAYPPSAGGRAGAAVATMRAASVSRRVQCRHRQGATTRLLHQPPCSNS